MTDASAPQRLAPTTDGGAVGPVMVIGGAEDKPVSYTHLTLPTICSV